MQKFRVSAVLVSIIASAIILLAGCGNDPEGSMDDGVRLAPPMGDYDPELPDDFVVGYADNTYFPLIPGTIFTYEGESDDEEEEIVVEVTGDTKEITYDGQTVICIVVKDTVWVDGQMVEYTLDWYAQDGDGNVWYFGEYTEEYDEDGNIDTAGSWEAGKFGAKPGIIMWAEPKVGASYRQEYYEGEAEDMAKVLRMNASVSVPWGDYEDCLVTKEWTPLELGVIEHKFYAPGVGVVLEIARAGGKGQVELVKVEP